jgi:hypothetical protein
LLSSTTTKTKINIKTRTKIATSVKSSPLLDRKIEEVGAGLQASYTNRLRSICEENTSTIVDFIAAMKSEANLSDHYRKDPIEMLCRLSKYNNNMPFRDMTRADILGFLDYFRKPESSDPLHKWIGTYNIYRSYLLRFFKAIILLSFEVLSTQSCLMQPYFSYIITNKFIIHKHKDDGCLLYLTKRTLSNHL